MTSRLPPGCAVHLAVQWFWFIRMWLIILHYHIYDMFRLVLCHHQGNKYKGMLIYLLTYSMDQISS